MNVVRISLCQVILPWELPTCTAVARPRISKRPPNCTKLPQKTASKIPSPTWVCNFCVAIVFVVVVVVVVVLIVVLVVFLVVVVFVFVGWW